MLSREEFYRYMTNGGVGIPLPEADGLALQWPYFHAAHLLRAVAVTQIGAEPNSVRAAQHTEAMQLPDTLAIYEMLYGAPTSDLRHWLEEEKTPVVASYTPPVFTPEPTPEPVEEPVSGKESPAPDTTPDQGTEQLSPQPSEEREEETPAPDHTEGGEELSTDETPSLESSSEPEQDSTDSGEAKEAPTPEPTVETSAPAAASATPQPEEKEVDLNGVLDYVLSQGVPGISPALYTLEPPSSELSEGVIAYINAHMDPRKKEGNGNTSTPPTQSQLIENFLDNLDSLVDKLKRANADEKEGDTPPPDLATKSSTMGGELASEMLAMRLASFQQWDAAISMLQRLMVRDPEKRAYFAALIARVEADRDGLNS